MAEDFEDFDDLAQAAYRSEEYEKLISKLVGVCLTCKKRNTRDWMNYLAETLNEVMKEVDPLEKFFPCHYSPARDAFVDKNGQGQRLTSN